MEHYQSISKAVLGVKTAIPCSVIIISPHLDTTLRMVVTIEACSIECDAASDDTAGLFSD